MINGVVHVALKDLVNGRCFLDKFPQSPNEWVWPAIRYSIVTEDAIPDICGTDDGETDETQVQIDYVAKTAGAALALRQQGRAALMATDPPCSRGSGFQGEDTETKTYRASDNYLFHPSSPASS